MKIVIISDVDFLFFTLQMSNKFEDQDRATLAEICKRYPAIMAKSYTNESLIKKNKAWRDIVSEFNACTPEKPPRELSQLQGRNMFLKFHSLGTLHVNHIWIRLSFLFPVIHGDRKRCVLIIN